MTHPETLQQPLLISVDGNIGSGKSTTWEMLKETYKGRLDVYFVEEPVGLWEQYKGRTWSSHSHKFLQGPQKVCIPVSNDGLHLASGSLAQNSSRASRLSSDCN